MASDSAEAVLDTTAGRVAQRKQDYVLPRIRDEENWLGQQQLIVPDLGSSMGRGSGPHTEKYLYAGPQWAGPYVRPDAGTQDELSSEINTATCSVTSFGHEELSILMETTSLERQIRQDLDEAVECDEAEDEVVPQKAAIETCRRLASEVIPHLVGHPEIRIAAFDEGDGVVSLVLQPVGRRRRLTLEVSEDGSQITEVRIDEALKLERVSFPASDISRAARSVSWVMTAPAGH